MVQKNFSMSIFILFKVISSLNQNIIFKKQNILSKKNSSIIYNSNIEVIFPNISIFSRLQIISLQKYKDIVTSINRYIYIDSIHTNTVHMEEKVIVVVRGAGEKVSLRVNTTKNVQNILVHLKTLKGKLGDLIRHGKYIVMSRTGQIRSLEETQITALMDSSRIEGGKIIDIELKEFKQSNHLSNQAKISENTVIKAFENLEEGDISAIMEMYEKGEISLKVFEFLARNIHFRENEQSNIKNLSKKVSDLESQSLLISKVQNSSLKESSYFSVGRQVKILLESSKTFDNFQEITEKASQFLKTQIQKYTNKKIRKIVSLFYDNGKTYSKRFHKDVEGKDNFIVLWNYKDKIFGVFCQHPFNEEQNNRIRNKGFFFTVNQERVFELLKDKSVWKYSPHLLIAGQKCLSMVSGGYQQNPKLHILGNLEQNFHTDGFTLQNLLGERVKQTLALDSFEFLQVKFVESRK